ncbi:hypothetical protein CDAR_290761, partial [Caerostris darwini]
MSGVGLRRGRSTRRQKRLNKLWARWGAPETERKTDSTPFHQPILLPGAPHSPPFPPLLSPGAPRRSPGHLISFVSRVRPGRPTPGIYPCRQSRHQHLCAGFPTSVSGCAPARASDFPFCHRVRPSALHRITLFSLGAPAKPHHCLPILFPGAPPALSHTSFPPVLSPGAPRRSTTPDFTLLSPGAPWRSPTPSFHSSVSGC